MPLFLGNKETDRVFLGTKELSQIYLGTKEIWSNVKTIRLNSGTEWDIKSLYPSLYKKLTNDNFFIVTANSVTRDISVRMRPGDDREWSGYNVNIVKSYDADTGKLSSYMSNTGGKGAVTPIIVTKTSKLIYLGKKTSFDLTNIAGYKNFTEDNFIIKGTDSMSRGMYFYDDGYDYADYGRGDYYLKKEYKKNEGTLSCYTKLSSRDTGGVYDWYSRDVFQGTASCEVYLIEKL